MPPVSRQSIPRLYPVVSGGTYNKKIRGATGALQGNHRGNYQDRHREPPGETLGISGGNLGATGTLQGNHRGDTGGYGYMGAQTGNTATSYHIEPLHPTNCSPVQGI